jgi:hypothetical protein
VKFLTTPQFPPLTPDVKTPNPNPPQHGPNVDDVVELVDVTMLLLVVVPPPPPPQAAGAGASFRLVSPAMFLISVPPNSAQ